MRIWDTYPLTLINDEKKLSLLIWRFHSNFKTTLKKDRKSAILLKVIGKSKLI